MRASPQHGSPALRFSAPLRAGRDAGFLDRAQGDRATGSGRSRGSTRPAAGRWPVRSWRRPSSSIPSASPRASTIPSGLRTDQREELFEVILRKALGRLVRFVSRPRPSTAPTSARPASRRCAARSPGLRADAAAGAGRRPRRAAGPCLRRPGAGQGRPALAVDRRRLDRRQGHARPHDGEAAARSDRDYGFEVHMGYATERHRAAIEVARRRARGCTA